MMTLTETNEAVKNVQNTSEQLKYLIYQYKKGRKAKQCVVPLTHPVVILMRRNKTIEFHQLKPRKKLLAKSGLSENDLATFKYQHTNGKEYEVNLTNIHSASYGSTVFNAYIHHEDHSSTLPFNPIFEIQRYKSDIQNSMSAEMKWKTEEQKARTGQLWAIAGIIGVIFVGIILYKMMIEPSAAVQTAAATPDIVKNVTAILGN